MNKLVCISLLLAFSMVVTAQTQVGDSLMELGNYQNAITAYSKAESSAQTSFKTGRAYTAMGNLDDAIIAYEKGIELDEAAVRARFELGRLYLNANDPVKGIMVFSKLTKEFPENATYLFYKGQALENLKSEEQAMDVYENVLKINPDYRNARIELVKLLIKNRENQLAIKYSDEILKEDHNDIKFNSLIAQAYFNAKVHPLAIDHLERLFELGNDTEFNRRTLGISYFNNRNWEKALESFNIFLIEYDPKDPAIYFLKSQSHLRLDQYDEALDAIQYAIAFKRPSIEQEYIQMSSVYAAQENLKEVFVTLSDAHKEYPENRTISYSLARAADQYFKDKASILGYYERYLNKFGESDSYGKYASSRVSDLKKEIFMSDDN